MSSHMKGFLNAESVVILLLYNFQRLSETLYLAYSGFQKLLSDRAGSFLNPVNNRNSA
jgi:hypothetical protein